MSKRIAIITGASGGIGREFTRLLLAESVEEIWAVARNKDKLAALKAEFGERIIPISKDLKNPVEVRSIGAMLEGQKPSVAFLINNAGIARMGSYGDFSPEEIEDTLSVNCTALTVLCTLCIPYMDGGCRILNISSAASFQPLPYLNLYAASKAFVTSYTRALHRELKPTGITATAVCPGWVDTELLTREANGKKLKFPGIVSAERVAKQALRDARKGRDMSVCSLYVKLERLWAKLLPQKIYMRMWLFATRHYR